MRRTTVAWMAGLTALALVVMSSGPAAARPWGGFPGGGHEGMSFLMLLRGVGLTDDQKVQVHQIVTNHRPQFQTLRTQLRTAEQAMRTKLIAPDPVTPADLAPLKAQIDQARGQLLQEGLQVAMEIRGILTPDQLAKAAQIRQRMGELRSEMRGLLGGH